MNDRAKTKAELIEEISCLNQRIRELGQAESERKRAEAALCESEEKYRQLHEAAGVGIGYYSPDGVVISFNRIAVQNMGGRAEDYVGKRVHELFPAPAADEYLARIQRCAAVEDYQIYEDRVELPTGAKLFHSVFTRIADAQGSVAGVQIVSTDITERKQAEDALRQSEEKFSILFKKAPYSAALSSIPDLKLLEVNEQFEKLWGYSAAEAVGKTSHELGLHPDPNELARLNAIFQECGFIHDISARMRSESGELKDVLINSDIISIGNKQYILSTVQNITERKRAEEEKLRLSEEIRLLLQSTGEGIYGTDTRGLFTFINRAGAVMLGYAAEELIGKVAHLIIHHHRADRSEYPSEQCPMYQTLHSGEGTRSDDEVLWRKDGTFFPVDFSSYPITREGEIKGVVVTFADITQRKLTEAKLRESEERFRAAFSISPVALYETDAKGNCINANEKWLGMAGLKMEEALGTGWQKGLHPDDRDYVFRNWYEHCADMKPWGYEYRFMTPGGEVSSVMGVASAIRNERGEITGYIGANMDITERKQAEAALREQEEQYRLLFNGITDAVFVHSIRDDDLPGVFLAVNDTACQRLGYTREELLRMTVLDIDAPESNVDRTIIVRKLRQGESLLFEQTHVAKDGRRIPVEVHVRAFLMRGQPLVLSVVRDITDRKRAEAVLRESEERFREIAETINEVFWVGAADWSEVYYVSPAYEQIWGRTVQSLYEQPLSWFDALHPDDRQVTWLDIDAKSHGRSATPDFMPYRVVRPDGSIRWIFARAFPILNPDGQVTRIVGIAEDITERKQVEEKLRIEAERFSLATKSGQLAVWDWNVKDNVMVWDDRMFELYGTTRELFPNCIDAWTNGLHSEDKERAIEECNAALRGEKEFDTEFRVLHPDGKILWLKANALVIRDAEGNAARMIGLNHDITILKHAEEEKEALRERLVRSEKMEALGQLAGGVAHDLNNVLGVSMIYSELLQEQLPEMSPLKKAADSILASTQKAAAIIEDLLTLARRGVVIQQVMNLNTLISGFLETATFEKIKQFNPRTTFAVELCSDPMNIKGSPVHMEKTLMNLVSNAVEAIGEEGVVTIRTENRYLDGPVQGYDSVREGEYVVLTVSDTGKGIPLQYLGKIFEPFFTKKTMGKSGTGLGLAIVWGTVKDHQGYIDVMSEEGKGSRFTCYLPATREAVAQKEEKIPIEQYMSHGESVLVIDDVQAQREVAATLLKTLGYKVHAVSGGEEAVEYLKGNNVDILVLDMIMDPGIDGLETYRRVLEVNPKQKAIIVSGFSETDKVREAQRLGAGAYIRKPYMMDKMGLAIRGELARCR
jgi:PAS domain S-box-containing protein